MQEGGVKEYFRFGVIWHEAGLKALPGGVREYLREGGEMKSAGGVKLRPVGDEMDKEVGG